MILDHLFTRTLFESQTDHITQFASNAHEEWRRNFDPTGTKPRIKKNSDGTEGDINVPFADLHPDWQKENLAAAHAAHRAVKHFGRDMEKAAEYVHNEWMKRNPKADYNAAQHVPYDDLPEDEKEKDRVHVRTMMQLMGHRPEQGVAEGLNEFAPDVFNDGDDSNDLQLYLNVAKKLNMKKYKPSTAHDLIAKKMAELVDVVDDAKVDWARHMARKAQGLPSMLDQQGVAEGSTNDYFKRRKDEEDRIAGTKAPAKRTPRQTDYEKKRKEQGVAEGLKENNHWHAAGVADAQRDVKRDPNRKVKTLNPRTRLKTMQDKQARHPEEVEQYSQGYRSVKQGVAESNTLMKKLHQALLQEGRVKELADDLKTLNDAEFMKKYGKAKAAIRKDMKKVDEGNANSGRRGPNSPPDNTPVKLGRVQKLKTGIKHHADSSRYGGTVPDTDDDHLLSPAARHRLHKAVTPDQQDLDEGNMPQSVIKSKQKYADMSDQEFHAAHKNKSEDDLKNMAWRHGYGKGSNHYVTRHKKGGSQLNELSTNKLAQYKTAAAADAKKADQAGDVKRGDKRFGGIVKATKKQFDNDAKKIDESRQARQALMARVANSR